MASVRSVEVLGVVSMVLVVGVASEDRAKIGRAQAIQTKIQRSRLRHERITGRKSPLVIRAPRGRKALRRADRVPRSRGPERRQGRDPEVDLLPRRPATIASCTGRESLGTRPLASREAEVSRSPGRSDQRRRQERSPLGPWSAEPVPEMIGYDVVAKADRSFASSSSFGRASG
jgi:hypothetical protein